MPGEELLLIGGAGVAAVVVAKAAPATKPTNLAPNGGVVTNVKPPGSSVAGGNKGAAPVAKFKMVVGHTAATTVKPVAATHEAGIHATQTSNSGVGSGMNSSDPQLLGKLQMIEAGMRDAYGALSADTKQTGANLINKQFGTSLDGNSSFDDVEGAIAGAIGPTTSQVGGVLGAKLRAMCKAYLGVNLDDLLASNWDAVKAWVTAHWGDITKAASDAWNAVSGALGGSSTSSGSSSGDPSGDTLSDTGTGSDLSSSDTSDAVDSGSDSSYDYVDGSY